jgi:hypothetical protein
MVVLLTIQAGVSLSLGRCLVPVLAEPNIVVANIVPEALLQDAYLRAGNEQPVDFVTAQSRIEREPHLARILLLPHVRVLATKQYSDARNVVRIHPLCHKRRHADRARLRRAWTVFASRMHEKFSSKSPF